MKGYIPLTASLPEAVEAFAEAPKRGGECESFRGAHVNFLIQGTIEVCSFDVELAKLKVVEGSKA
jgi:hypothetical protein